VRVTIASVGARLNHLHMSARMGDSAAAPVLFDMDCRDPRSRRCRGDRCRAPDRGLLNVEAFADDENETIVSKGASERTIASITRGNPIR